MSASRDAIKTFVGEFLQAHGRWPENKEVRAWNKTAHVKTVQRVLSEMKKQHPLGDVAHQKEKARERAEQNKVIAAFEFVRNETELTDGERVLDEFELYDMAMKQVRFLQGAQEPKLLQCLLGFMGFAAKERDALRMRFGASKESVAVRDPVTEMLGRFHAREEAKRRAEEDRLKETA